MYLKNDVDKAFKTIKERIDYLESQNESLMQENERLRSEHYKDEELSKMRDKLLQMNADYYRGFPVSEEEEKQIREWMNKHDEEVHNCHTLDDRLRRGGAIGGTYTYKFIPTSIGTVGTVKCSCGAEFKFQDI